MKKLFALGILSFMFFASAAPAHAQMLNGLTIVPEACQSCPAAWNCVMATANNLVTFAVSIGVTIVVVVIAWAGVLLVMTPTNPENRGRASKMLINAVIGLIIVLAAWLIIDKILGVLGADKVDSVADATSVLGHGSGACIQKGTGDQDTPTNPPVNPDRGTFPDNEFTYDPGIRSQVGHASGPLATLLTCMAGKVPGNVGRISSISDSNITSGNKTFSQCAASGCNHTNYSCHYGGRECIGSSYAVDFGDEQNARALTDAAKACGGQVLNEGNHLHVSVGEASGCRCDQGW